MCTKPIVDVSIIIPSFNRARLLSETLDSVLSQTVQAREIIVVDDGSTDNTSEVLKEYGDKIRYLFQENQGVSAARNYGVRVASSKYIAFNDSDDHWLPEKLEKQVAAMEENPHFIAHVCNVSWLKKDGSLVSQSFRQSENGGDQRSFIEGELDSPLQWVLRDSVAVIQTIMVQASVLKISGLFDDTLSLWEDTDFAARVALCGPWGFTNQPLVNVREIDEDSERLSSNRNNLVDSLGIRRSVLGSLLEKKKNNKQKHIIKAALARTTYALAKAKVGIGELKEAKGYYIESFNLGVKLKSAVMLFFLVLARGKFHAFLRYIQRNCK